jgi:hypothetical protein
LEDEKVQEIKCNIKEEKSPGFSEDDEGVLWIGLSILVFYRRRELSFEVEDFVYLNASSMRGLRHFKVRGKFALRFIGPFKILKKSG